jgi:hypothetical protein
MASRLVFTIRRLRELAMQRLGALAAQLKTKDELYDALAEHAPDALGLEAEPKKKAARDSAKAETKPARKVTPSPRSKPAPKEPPRPVAVSTRESPPAPEITAPQRLPKKQRPAPDRAVVRDFFVPPGSRALPASFGDDRVMLFPRDPGGIFVSWDLSPKTWGEGGLRLVLRTHDGHELWSQTIDTPHGAVSIEGDFGGASIRAVIERSGEGVGASPAVLMPGSPEAFAERWKVHVDPDETLPLTPRKVGPAEGPPEPAGALGENSRLLSAARGKRGGAPSRLR